MKSQKVLKHQNERWPVFELGKPRRIVTRCRACGADREKHGPACLGRETR